MTFEPSPKDPELEVVIQKLTGKNRTAVIKSNGCMTCDVGLVCRLCNTTFAAHSKRVCEACHIVESPDSDRVVCRVSISHHYKENAHSFQPFRTPLDEVEYGISGMCQSCQDKIFDPEDD